MNFDDDDDCYYKRFSRRSILIFSSLEAFSEAFHLKVNTFFTSYNGLVYFDVKNSRVLQ